EYTVQFGHSLTSGMCDFVDGGSGQLRVRSQDAPCHSRLHRRHSQSMADRIVDLASEQTAAKSLDSCCARKHSAVIGGGPEQDLRVVGKEISFGDDHGHKQKHCER